MVTVKASVPKVEPVRKPSDVFTIGAVLDSMGVKVGND